MFFFISFVKNCHAAVQRLAEGDAGVTNKRVSHVVVRAVDLNEALPLPFPLLRTKIFMQFYYPSRYLFHSLSRFSS